MRRIVAVANNPQQRHGIDRLLLLLQLSQQGSLNGAVSPAHSLVVGRLSCSGQYREEPILKILVHLIDRLVHGPTEMLIHLGPCDGKRLWYRTFAVEKYKMTECILGIIAALFRVTLQQNLYAQCVFEH